MPALTLPISLAADIAAAGVAAYPQECCGVLIGRDAPDKRAVERLLPVQNSAGESERRKKFVIEPADLLAAEKSATAGGQTVLGFYHSHPDHPARPSATDRENAWPFYSYVIVSIGGESGVAGTGYVLDLTSWVLDETSGSFVRQELKDGN